MNEIFSFTLQDLEPLLTKNSCGCHFINPNKTRIILWKEIKADGTEIYHLRIGIQKFISYPLKDKNKALYWRFKAPEIKVEVQKSEEKQGVYSELSETQKVEETINPDPNNPITKYQQRLAKTEAINYDKSNSTVNSSEQSESISH